MTPHATIASWGAACARESEARAARETAFEAALAVSFGGSRGRVGGARVVAALEGYEAAAVVWQSAQAGARAAGVTACRAYGRVVGQHATDLLQLLCPLGLTDDAGAVEDVIAATFAPAAVTA